MRAKTDAPAGNWFSNLLSQLEILTGGVPEWLKGTDCKSVGFAYAGSNPAPSTRAQVSGIRFRNKPLNRGCSSMVEQQPSKLMTRVRFPSPAPIHIALRSISEARAEPPAA